MRDSRQTEAHLDAAKRSGQHEVIKAAEMPNSKHFARKLGKPRPYGHVESLKDDVPQAVGVVSIWHKSDRHPVRVFSRLLTDELQPPGPYRVPRCVRPARIPA